MSQRRQRLVRGGGQFVDDIRLPGTLEMAVLRSPYAHAGIRALSTAAAVAAPEVALVLTAAGLVAAAPLPPVIGHPGLAHPRGQPVLAADQVRFAGEAVAAVVAANRYAAEDALEAIEVEYAPLPAVTGVPAALAAGAPLVHPEAGTNVAGGWTYRTGDLDAALAAAQVTIECDLELARGHGNPVETRGVLCRYDPATGELTAWITCQSVHWMRGWLAAMVGLPVERVRVVTPDMGGAFGLKTPIHPEYVLAALASMRTGRPVRWVEDRREHLLACHHDREQYYRVQAAATRDGRLLGLRVHLAYDLGAYSVYGLLLGEHAALHMHGPYRLQALEVQMQAVYTHRMFTGAYRGAGRPNGTFVVERVLDRLARTLGMDPVEVRRRNLIPAADMPYRTGLVSGRGAEIVYDSGDLPALLDQALHQADLDRWRALQARRRSAGGPRVGIGVACYLEETAGGGPEGATVRVDGEQVHLELSLTTHGQGQPEALAALVARELAVAPDRVQVWTGDTGRVPNGTGTFGSRGTVLAGSAARAAARSVADQACRLGAALLECSPEDLELADGRVQVRGSPQRGLALGQLAQARPEEALAATSSFAPANSAWTGGAAVAVVEVDPETAAVRLLELCVAEDCGNVLDPAGADGQLAGAAAQAIGSTLYERLAYDDGGQLLSATLMDYTMPTAVEVPPIRIAHQVTPSPGNPLGAKGAGEGGAMPVAPAVAAAVEDALAPWGVAITRLPLTLADLRQAMAPAAAPRNGTG